MMPDAVRPEPAPKGLSLGHVFDNIEKLCQTMDLVRAENYSTTADFAEQSRRLSSISYEASVLAETFAELHRVINKD